MAATVAAGCTSASDDLAQTAPAAPAARAASAVPERNHHVTAQPASVPPSQSVGPAASPSQAFVDGYHAYRKHDLALAVARLGYAAEHFPALTDYALYYLGLAEYDKGDLPAASQTLERLARNYPQSVTVPKAELALAKIHLALGHVDEALAAASKAVSAAPDSQTEQAARLAVAKALAAKPDPRAAYNELMALREKFPRDPQDADARRLAYSILAAHPAVANLASPEYFRDEAGLLLSEGEPAIALSDVRKGLQLSPLPAVHAQLVFLKARALRSSPDEAQAAYREYLRLAPMGPSAAASIEALGLIYWNEDRREEARAQFTRLVAQFPQSTRAPVAMLRIGRTYEEDGDLGLARAQYLRLLARHPGSQAAADARFRAPWMLYMGGHYVRAAKEFAAMRERAPHGNGVRDMFAYWQARALENAGRSDSAREIFRQVARSVESNYYPELASRRIMASPPELGAAKLSDPDFSPPAMVSGPDAFHVERVLTLRNLGLKDLVPPELRVLARRSAAEPALARFVLAGFESAGAYYDAIVAATAMERRGQLGHDLAERVRYPRAYWDLVTSASARNGLDPYLVLALMRQESWFNPLATSGSDARGLMQLLPVTGRRFARNNALTHAINLYDPVLNVELGTAYLKNLLEMFGNDPVKALAAYNAGEHAVQSWNATFSGSDDEWVENIGFHETRDYVKRVIGGRREYKLLYGSNGSRSTAAARSPG